MSLPDEMTITCPKCGHEQDFTIWSSVNVTNSPELKAKILSGELVQFCCTQCGHTSQVVYPMLYHDMEQDLMIWLFPGEEPPPDDSLGTSAMLRGLSEGYQCRWVQSFNELLEKILLFDADIDDRIFEWFKIMMRSQWSGNVADSDDIFFSGSSESDGEPVLGLTVISQDGCREATIPSDVFDGLAKHAKGHGVFNMFPVDATWPRVNHHYLQEGADD
jgi:hypothetical protein